MKCAARAIGGTTHLMMIAEEKSSELPAQPANGGMTFFYARLYRLRTGRQGSILPASGRRRSEAASLANGR
jgi:hypothetical protein